jgi:hypothetical protein
VGELIPVSVDMGGSRTCREVQQDGADAPWELNWRTGYFFGAMLGNGWVDSFKKAQLSCAQPQMR